MNDYLVSWIIDAEGDSPRGAAQSVFSHHFNGSTTANVFQVVDINGTITQVDLLEDEEDG